MCCHTIKRVIDEFCGCRVSSNGFKIEVEEMRRLLLDGSKHFDDLTIEKVSKIFLSKHKCPVGNESNAVNADYEFLFLDT